MAKKERPRLIMADNIAVTDLQSLKEHFDWEKALQYYKTGELVKWLRRLYLDEEADALEQLDSRSADFPKEFCAIFGVEYTGGDKPYIPPSNSRTRTTMGQRRKAPVPPPRPVAMPKPEAPAASPSPSVAPVSENVADAGMDFDFGEAFDSDFTEEAFVEEEPPAASTAETLPEVTEASPMPITEPSEPVPAMPLSSSEPPIDVTPRSAPQSSSPNNSSGLGGVVGCFLFIIAITGVIGIAWSFISSLWSSFDSKEEKTEPPTKIEQQQKKEEKQEKQPAPVVTDNPREASIKTFRAYHENLTKRDFQQAWACFDREMQDYFNYDNWVSGHQTTVKSNPYDIKVVSESPEKVVLSYTLQAVDNPGGEKLFDGKAIMVKTETGWKINDIENTLKQPTAPKPQPAPAAPPTTSPKPTPAAPSAPPVAPEIEYRTFTENWYGFSFEYPASEGDFQQADSRNGERAVEYWIDFPNNQGTVLAGTEFTNFSSADVDARNCADDNRSNDYEVLGTTSYILTYRRGNETRIRKTFLVPSHYKDSTGFVRQYIELRKRGKMSPQNQEIAQHMMDSFSPGE